MVKPIRTVSAVYLYLKVDIYNMGIGILIGGVNSGETYYISLVYLIIFESLLSRYNSLLIRSSISNELYSRFTSA